MWNRALVTGASSGIGKAIAKQLSAAGTDLVLVARDGDRLTALASSLDVRCEVLQADLGDPAELLLVESRLESETDPIDLLVNNAGLGFSGSFADMDRAQASYVIAVNVVAVQRLTHAALSRMRTVDGGTILNVSSLAGEAVGANSATYNATKAFVTNLGQSLAVELADTNITLTTLLPGFTTTEFRERAGTDSSDIPDILWQSAEAVAAAALSAAANGAVEVVPSKRYRAIRATNHLLPARVRRTAASRVMKR